MVHFQRWLLFSCISKDILVNDTAYVTDKLKNKNNISGTVQFNIIIVTKLNNLIILHVNLEG